MKKYLFLVLLITGCSKPKHLLEIYLLETRAKNKYGITSDEFLKKQKLDSSLIKDLGLSEFTTFDTINKSFIYAGEFDIMNCNLKNEPFILDSEIEYLDITKNKIAFNKSGAIKIGSLPGTMREGIQFVITDNKVPIFGGHFWSIFSSYGSNWNSILYVHKITGEKPKEDLEYLIFEGEGMKTTLDKHVNFEKYPKLIKAFSETNRLKK